jgi:hypothetical protein
MLDPQTSTKPKTKKEKLEIRSLGIDKTKKSRKPCFNRKTKPTKNPPKKPKHL